MPRVRYRDNRGGGGRKPGGPPASRRARVNENETVALPRRTDVGGRAQGANKLCPFSHAADTGAPASCGSRETGSKTRLMDVRFADAMTRKNGTIILRALRGLRPVKECAAAGQPSINLSWPDGK